MLANVLKNRSRAVLAQAVLNQQQLQSTRLASSRSCYSKSTNDLLRESTNTCSSLMPQICWRSFSSSPSERIKLPPNLQLDPRSSFFYSVEKKSTKVSDSDSIQKEQEDSPADSDHVDNDYDDEDDDEDDDEVGQFLQVPAVNYALPLPERLNVPIYSFWASKSDDSTNNTDDDLPIAKVGTLWLDESVFGNDPIRIDLMQQAVHYYRSKKRGIRKAVTKTISQVAGSGRKMRQQKGSGRARMGHRRPLHHRGGAKAHGPKNVTDYGKIKLNKKVRRQALRHALTQKLAEGNLMLLDEWTSLPTHKTKELLALLKPLNIGGKNGQTALILDHYEGANEDTKGVQEKSLGVANDETSTNSAPSVNSYKGVPINLWVASSNLERLTIANHHGANVYDILKHDKLLLTLSALEQIEGRLKQE